MGNSSSTASSSTTNGEQYDVFLSFRGEDTRDGFTSHLYKALDEKQIKTFIDNQLVRGEEISAGLLSVIRESKISVVIFSENYASSKWCLRELTEIMKYREMKNQIVIPVFYKVDPSHVRKQIGSYEAALAKHELQQVDEVKKWREALTEASNISGWDSSETRNESEFVYNIIRDVWNKLYNISPSCDFPGLVGIYKHIERVVSLLCLGVPDFRIIGICGMGGIGKTTVADAIFQLVSHQFENPHFAPCLRAESEKNSSGLISLRDEIISKVLNEENLKIGSPSINPLIKRRLNQKKVLIVLDDVDESTNFGILTGGLDRFGPGSRIILTTRDKQVLRNCGVQDHNMYEVEELNDDEALKLFYNCAFMQNHPEDLKVLSRNVVKIAKNLPLAVIVLGSSLYKKSKQDWENAVDKFQRNVHHRVLDVLKISYDGLDEEEKGLFLDIACFPLFQWLDDLRPILLSDREFSLSALIDKSLVTMENGWIRMHDLLREMGREIARKNHSRLWRQEDIIRTLKHNDGIANAVQGIYVEYMEDTQLISQAIEIMYNLRTLIIDCPYWIGDLYYLPDGLRYLHWHMYPLEVLPLSFNPMNLVELDLSHSKIKQLWEVKTPVQKLKLLNLSCCENLIKIPDLSDIPSAERIDLQFCSSLIEIHSSRGCPKLEQLNLSCCQNLIRIPDLSDIPSAESIDLRACRSLIEIHSSRECPKNLHSLNLLECKDLSRLPSNIHIEGSEFNLVECINLTKFPHISGSIKRLELCYSGVEEVPSTIQSLSKLERLNMDGCESLKRISKSICKLKSLDWLNLCGCCKLESFPDIMEEMELKYLNLRRTAIKDLPPSIGNLNRLEELYFCGCKNLERLPKSIKKLSKLYSLKLNDCGMLRSLPELPSSLQLLEAINCKQLIQSLPDSSSGSGSLYFNFINCLKMKQEAVSNLLIFFRDSLRKMQRMGTEKIISLFERDEEEDEEDGEEDERVKVSICLPGSEIPEWFSYKNNGSSINIPGLRNDCGSSSYIMGFAVCLVIGFEDYNDALKCAWLYSIDVYYDFHIETSDGHKEGFVGNKFQLSGRLFLGSDHILLGYNLSRKCYKLFQELDTLLANRGMSGYVGTSFEFNIRSTDFFGCSINLRPRCEVKYCGIQPIYVQAQVMNSVSINQDTGDTSGCNDTAEETCEPHPKRICT